MNRSATPVRVAWWISLTFVTCAPTAAQAVTRNYYIAAEDVVWDYAPLGQSMVHCTGVPAPCPIPQPWTTSHVFTKTRYIEHTDASFTIKKISPRGWACWAQ